MPDGRKCLKNLANRRRLGVRQWGHQPQHERRSSSLSSSTREDQGRCGAGSIFHFFFPRHAGCSGRASGSEPSEMRGSTPSRGWPPQVSCTRLKVNWATATRCQLWRRISAAALCGLSVSAGREQGQRLGPALCGATPTSGLGTPRRVALRCSVSLSDNTNYYGRDDFHARTSVRHSRT